MIAQLVRAWDSRQWDMEVWGSITHCSNHFSDMACVWLPPLVTAPDGGCCKLPTFGLVTSWCHKFTHAKVTDKCQVYLLVTSRVVMTVGQFCLLQALTKKFTPSFANDHGLQWCSSMHILKHRKRQICCWCAFYCFLLLLYEMFNWRNNSFSSAHRGNL